MKALDCTEQEALQIIEDDKKIDKGEKLFELTSEQKTAARKVRQVKPTVYKFDTSKKEKVKNSTKLKLIESIKGCLENLAVDSLEISNPEREINFTMDGTKYKIVLSAPRK